MKKFALPCTIIAILCLLTFSGGCNGENEPSETLDTENNRWMELLGILPENDITLNSTFIQTEAYGAIMQKEMDERTDEEITETLIALIVHNNLSLFGKTGYTDEEWIDTVGFAIGDVTESVISHTDPVHEYQAVSGDFTAEDIEYAAKNGPLSEYLEINTYEGYEYYSWGEDNAVHLDPEWRSNIRNLGRGHRLAYIDGYAIWVIWTEGLEDMIDACKGNIPSLADNEDIKLLAAKLDTMNTVTAFFSARPLSKSGFDEAFESNMQDLREEGQEAQVEAFENEKLLKPFTAFAAGAGTDETGNYLTIILLNENEKTAKENADLLEWRINESIMAPFTRNLSESYKKWTDNDAITSMEIRQDGRFTIAELYGRVHVYWDSFSFPFLRSGYFPLLLHE